MSRIQFVPVIAVLLLVSSVLAAEQPRPVMVLSEETWDLGTLQKGQTVSKTIQIKNEGNADLRINYIRSLCAACIGTLSGTKRIPPGKSTRLVLTFYSKRAEGRQNKAIYVHGNDPVHPYKAIRIVGTVTKGPRPEIRVEPALLDVGLITRGKRSVHVLSIANVGTALLKVKGVATSGACSVAAGAKDPIRPGARTEIKVAVDGAKLEGLIQEFVTIQTNDPVTPSNTVAVVGYASASVSQPGTGRAVVIQPVGDPVQVPGTKTVFFPAYRVTNLLPSTVKLILAGGDGRPSSAKQVRELKPGERRSIKVPVERLKSRGALTVTILLPATLADE